MPWSNQSGGGGGGGPWRQNPGPWGSGPQSSGPTPPDLEDLLRRGQDRLRRAMPGGGPMGGKTIALIAILGLIGWGLTGFYRVQADERGVVLRFGQYVSDTAPGLHYHLPYPIETVLLPKVTRVNRVDVGMRIDDGRRAPIREVTEESLMLTGDENIVDVNFSVFWVINDAPRFLFNIQNPEASIKAVAESAMREVIGNSTLQPILTGARQTTEAAVQDLMQRTLDTYQAGVQISQVQLQKVDPPQQVIDAFRDVQAARADQERIQNEAQAYANRVVPEARGEAARITQSAEAYSERVVAEATGQASRFSQIYTEYAKAPDITRQRLFLETMERVYSGMDKVIIDQKNGGNGGQGVVPYLPLNELQRNAPQQQAPRTSGDNQ